LAPIRTSNGLRAGVFASALIVAGWGFFLYKGAVDPDGGTKALWPIFGIANQLLATIALCLATTILLKKLIVRKARLTPALVTFVPLVWLLAVTCTASVQKVWGPASVGGFLVTAKTVESTTLPAKRAALEQATRSGDAVAVAKAHVAVKNEETKLFNNQVDAWVTAFFLVLVVLVVLLSLREWVLLLRGRRAPDLSETEPVYLPAAPLAPAAPIGAFGAVALGFALLKEVSGEAAMEREATAVAALGEKECDCEAKAESRSARRKNVYLTVTDRQFRSPNRCC
jgi:carbon starvation protein